MKTVTVDDILSLRPCGWDGSDDGENYTRARLERLFAGRERVSARDVVAADIPREDVIWLLTQPIFMNEHKVGLFACDCAERVRTIYEAEYPIVGRLQKVIDTKRRHLRLKATGEELSAARKVAWGVAVAASSGSNTAAWQSARAAAWAVEGNAEDAAWAAALAAGDAGDAEREWQIQRALEYIESEGE